MSEFPWFSAYPEGVPHEIDPDLYPSIPAILDEAARKFPDRIGYTNMGVGLSYRRTVELSKQFAAYLQSRPDLKPGDRVAVMMPNLLQYVVAVFGILRAGLIVVNVNPLYTAREVNHTLRDSGAKAIVIIENFAKTLEQAIGGTACKDVITTAVGDLFPFPKRQIVNFVVRSVKKWCRPIRFRRPWVSAKRSKSAAQPLSSPFPSKHRYCLPAIYRGHNGHCQGC